MQRDWESGAGLICQEEDEMLGWSRRREGKREERVGPRDEGTRGGELQRGEPSRTFVLQPGLCPLSVCVTNFSFKLFHTRLMRVSAHLSTSLG